MNVLRGDRLRQLREQRGLSQREFADVVDMGYVMIHRYEHGLTDPTASTLIRLAKELRVSVDYLVGLSDDPGTPVSEGGLELDEQHLIDAYRRDGWAGLLRLAAAWAASPKNHP
jgi:transcriptional regulator with XRE-family HTH domain